MSDASDDSDNDSSSSLAPEDTLVGGRAKRAGAGNRLSHLLQHLDDDDVKADLLAEEDDDQQDYTASEAEDGDVALDSSSDSEDDAKANDDDLVGEKELKKQERVESRKKRKARELVRVQPLKKRVKIEEPSVISSPAPVIQRKPRPISRFAPTRHSSRTQTIASAKITEAKVKENRKRALKTQEVMRLAAERRAAEAGPKLTQADRMARALEIEKDNSRSLNRWERSEQERLRLQEEKLEAMRNRKFDGPVIRYWSGPVTWIWREGADGHPVYARCKYQRRSKPVTADGGGAENDAHKEEIAATEKVKSSEEGLSLISLDQTKDEDDGTKSSSNVVYGASPAHDELAAEDDRGDGTRGTSHDDTTMLETDDHKIANERDNANDQEFLDGIHLYIGENVTSQGQRHGSVDQREDSGNMLVAADPAYHRETSTIPIPNGDAEAPTSPHSEQADQMVHERDQTGAEQVPAEDPATAAAEKIDEQNQQPATSLSSLPLHREQASRILVMLDQFTELADAPLPSRRTSTNPSALASFGTASNLIDPALANIILPRASQVDRPLTAEQLRYLAAKPRKTATRGDSILPPPPEQPTCVITGKPARFRDPRTGLPYADVAASKAIQRVMANGCQYSALLGVWAGIVGEGALGRVARGVPQGFWSGKVADKPEKTEVIELN